MSHPTQMNPTYQSSDSISSGEFTIVRKTEANESKVDATKPKAYDEAITQAIAEEREREQQQQQQQQQQEEEEEEEEEDYSEQQQQQAQWVSDVIVADTSQDISWYHLARS